jgi:menaquinol-cytochrome c reductase iron-sulfur subunit
MAANNQPSRRQFHTSFIYGLWSLIAGALSLPAVVYLLFPPRPRKEGQWVEAGDVAQMPLRTPEEVVFRRNRVDGWKVSSEKTTAWVVRMSEKEVVAFAPQCTHLGCAYHWEPRNGNFLCPCHTSAFSIEGKVLSGPAPRPLDRYQAKVEGGKLLIGPMEESKS